MSISTYAELQSAVSAWLLRSASDAVVTTAQVKNYISLCEAELNRELKVRELEEDAALPTTAAQDYVTLPSDFAKVESLEFDDNGGDLGIISSRKELKKKYGNVSARPREYAIWGQKIILGATPDTVYNMTLYYYKKIPALSDANTTNAILTAFPDLYLYGSIRHGAIQIANAEKKAEAEANYVAAIERIRLADMESRLAHSVRMKLSGRRLI